MSIVEQVLNPQRFSQIGLSAPAGVLLYGPPGTGKTLLARCLACQIDAKFLKVVASSIVDKYIGESARVIREMFAYAKENQPCIIFMDEIDAIGGRRFSGNDLKQKKYTFQVIFFSFKLEKYSKITTLFQTTRGHKR